MLNYIRIMSALKEVDPEMHRWLLEVEPSKVNLQEVQAYLKIMGKETKEEQEYLFIVKWEDGDFTAESCTIDAIEYVTETYRDKIKGYKVLHKEDLAIIRAWNR